MSTRETSAATILVVDDDAEIRDLVAAFLRKHGFEVITTGDGSSVDAMLSRHAVGLVVLDLMLPGEDGLSVCRRLRAKSDIPIIILTAKGEALERIIGLEMGADDYLPKPFDPRELVARIRAVLARAGRSATTAGRRAYRFAGWILDIGAHSLRHRDGRVVELSTGEFTLLRIFVESSRQVLSRDRLLDLTRGRDFTPFDRSIDVQVSRLRRKIEDPAGPRLIKTVHGTGYVFTAAVERG
jgi:two-component system OmpR family response regulator